MKKYTKSLAETHPELAAQWHPTKNGELTPYDVTAGYNKKVWWMLPYDVPNNYPVEHLRGKHFNFEWETEVKARIRGYGCPYLSKQAIWIGFNDLATTHPELAKEWHPTKNGDLTPYDITSGYNKKVWWLLQFDVPDDWPVESIRGKHFDFEWETEVKVRTSGYGCPYLSGHAIWVGFNDLATTHPELAKEWHPTKNGDLTSHDISVGSREKVWWLLPYDVPNDYPVEHLRGKHFDFEWETEVKARIRGYGCPYLSKQAIWVGFNDLATTHPELAKEWHPTKNGDLTPHDITSGYNKKVWWLLPYDVPNDYPVKHLRGKHFDFEWETKLSNRKNKGHGCPYLSGQAVWVGFNDLATTHPELAKEWHPTKNGDLTPFDVTAGYTKKVWWLLPYDVPNDYSVAHLRGKHFDFEWFASVCNRKNKKLGCPYLSGQAVWVGFNDLATTHPELTKEWHPTKNGDLTPFDVTSGYDKKVWWHVTDNKNCIHEWSTVLNQRTCLNTGCPDFANSHGEKYVKKYLSKKKIKFESQKTFSNLFGLKNGKLSYDIFFKLNNTSYLVEYNGLQHYEPVEYFGGNEQFLSQQEHDRRKREYAKENNITLIEISYKYDTYEKVAQYLDEILVA